ncbi:hypothetical protein M408DRAFT_66438 [Serendipita vermifera MAFF 305830]|uniref:MATE efflux family protein n=1 Tax=Serendipita vermifera MAFF 305830 TaxID=933852 RepID=A0A0C3BG87_SERVB|nr:hypothetical protein M408DRAFT_66438 [Serendipita vermifera MAFF 305830]
MAPSPSHNSNGKTKHDTEWPHNGRDSQIVTNNAQNANETTPLISTQWNDSGRDNESEGDMVWWKELKTLGAYTLPVFGTHVLEYSLSIAPVVSIGHISTDALAAVTLGTMTASVTGFSIIVGFSTALDTMLPSAWTSGTPSLVGLLTIRMTVIMAMVVVPIVALWMNAETILLTLRQEPEIAHLAGIYLKWFTLGLPAYAANAILSTAYSHSGLFTIPTRVLFIVAPTNILLNYLLVWGPPWIRLGFIGAPIATAISFNLITFCYCVYGGWFTPKDAWHPLTGDCLRELGVLFKLGIAGVAQVAAEWWSWELVALAASQIGSLELAVQSVCLVSASTSYQAPYAISAATSVRIGNMLGARSAKRAALATRVAIYLTLMVALVMSTIFFVFKDNWAYMFNSDPQVVDEVARIMPVVALFQIFDGLGAVTGAILRAKGQQDVGALLSVIGYYILGIPLGLVLAFKLGLGLIGLWIGLTLSLVFVGLVGLYLCTVRTDWEEEVRKTMMRLGYEYDTPAHDSTTSTIVA